ncbi:MAG: hypothetical protein ACXADY_27245, partial [Candidatus Hodarchaeales archaeon]
VFDYYLLIRTANLFRENLTQIGVKIDIPSVTWPEYSGFSRMEEIFTQFVPSGWELDFLDPYNTIETFYYNSSVFNWCNLNDPQLQLLMDQATVERNSELRGKLYNKIQKRLVEELYPTIWWWSPVYHLPLSSKVGGFNLKNPFDYSFEDLYLI